MLSLTLALVALAAATPTPDQSALPDAPHSRVSVPMLGVSLSGNDAAGTYLWHHTVGYNLNDDPRPLASPMPYPANRVDSTRRPGFGGPTWNDQTFIGGVDDWATNSNAAAYGAVGHENQSVPVRVGPYTVSVNAWDQISPKGSDGRAKEQPAKIRQHIEDARNQWLKENGYVGSVRTVTNPAAALKPARHAIDLTPKAVIPAPDDQPKLRSRMQVQAPTSSPLAGARVSLPPGMSSDVKSAAQAVNAKANTKQLAADKPNSDQAKN